MNIRTVKVELNLDKDQKHTIKNTMLCCKGVFDYFVQLGCEHKSTSYVTLHKYGYHVAKEKYPDLPTAYIQSTAKQALACLKSWNTSVRNKLTRLNRQVYNLKKSDPKNKIPKILEKIEKTKSLLWSYTGSKTSMQLCLNKTSLSRRGDLTTFSSNEGRIRILHEIPNWFLTRYCIDSNKVQSGFLKYYTKDDKFVLFLSYKIKIFDCQGTDIVGIDRGLYNLAVLSDGKIYSSKKCKSIKRKYQFLRSKLQQKGTRSAKRKLKAVAGKEKRFMLDCNHCITKSLANRADVSTYVLENLNSIRSARKGKKFNSWLSNWSYFQFQSQLEYKCFEKGILVVYVDPRYTSQKCNSCGLIEKSNRHKSKYICSCGYSNHADINAALNIRDNYVRSLKSEQANCQLANRISETY